MFISDECQTWRVSQLLPSVREHYVGAYHILTFSISLSPSMVYEQLLVVSEFSLVLHPCVSLGRYHRLYIYFSLILVIKTQGSYSGLHVYKVAGVICR